MEGEHVCAMLVKPSMKRGMVTVDSWALTRQGGLRDASLCCEQHTRLALDLHLRADCASWNLSAPFLGVVLISCCLDDKNG